LGRLDRRVEIRGFRVELGEVEAALEQHPRVGDRVATVQGEGDGRRLVAFAVVSPRPADPGPSAADLQAFLRGRLPEFAVPTVQLLNALPLTENGKVDLGSLPQVRASALLESAPRIAPRDAVETTVADAFAEVLGVRHRPSVDAGFFDLGGHSMLTAQLVSTLRERLGVDLPIRSALKNPSIADLADRIRRITGVASSAGEEGLG
ncbi:MAG: phosphopantetheine-binding protein, partial [Acidobacteriota bacterium]